MPSLGSLVTGAIAAAGLSSSKTRDGEATFVSTRVIVSFHTDEGFDGTVDSSPGERPDQPFRIVGYTTDKAFGGNPGTWTLTVKGRNGTDVQRLWQDPEDVWVRIVAVKNGEPHEVMFGLMNTVTDGMTRGTDGARSVTYTLSGFDWHKVLTSTTLYINIHENAGRLPIIPLYNAVSENLIGPPEKIVKTLIDAWIGNNGVADKQWALPASLAGGYLYDLLELDFGELRGQMYDPALYSPDQMMGKSLWQTLQEYSNGMLNELYTTTFEDAPFDANTLPSPTLTLRERPFPSKDKGHRSWDALITHELKPGDIKGRQMSRGAPESRFNYWLLDASGLVGNGLGVQMQIQQAAGMEKGLPGSAPIYNIEDIRRHGFRKFQQSTRYFPFREDLKWLTHSAQWLKLLHDWYVVAPFELSGTLSCSQVFPGIRIGHRAIEKRKTGEDVTYYVEGVSQSWQYPNNGLTTLRCTRGEFADEDLLDIAYERVSSGEANALDSAIEAAVGLVLDTPLGNEVPHGSGPKLDLAVGQVDTAERLYLKRRGKVTADQTHIRRGEVDNVDEGRTRVLRPADLPDQTVSHDDEILVGRSKPRERRQGGNLTQDELERGVRLPVKESQVAATEPSKEPADQAQLRWRTKNRVRGSAKG